MHPLSVLTASFKTLSNTFQVTYFSQEGPIIPGHPTPLTLAYWTTFMDYLKDRVYENNPDTIWLKENTWREFRMTCCRELATISMSEWCYPASKDLDWTCHQLLPTITENSSIWKCSCAIKRWHIVYTVLLLKIILRKLPKLLQFYLLTHLVYIFLLVIIIFLPVPLHLVMQCYKKRLRTSLDY